MRLDHRIVRPDGVLISYPVHPAWRLSLTPMSLRPGLQALRRTPGLNRPSILLLASQRPWIWWTPWGDWRALEMWL